MEYFPFSKNIPHGILYNKPRDDFKSLLKKLYIQRIKLKNSKLSSFENDCLSRVCAVKLDINLQLTENRNSRHFI